jgi:hypothetical protein
MWHESLYLLEVTFIMLSVLGTYQVHTDLRSTYLVRNFIHSVRTWDKSTYQVRTWDKKYVLKRSSTRWYDTIPEYKVVRTGLYWVRTTSHDSRWWVNWFHTMINTYNIMNVWYTRLVSWDNPLACKCDIMNVLYTDCTKTFCDIP